MRREELPKEYVRFLLDQVGEPDVLDFLLEAGWIPPLSTEPIEVTVRLEHVKHGDGEIEHYRMYCDESLAHDKLVDIFFPWIDKDHNELRMKDALVFVVHHTAESITLRKEWVDDKGN